MHTGICLMVVDDLPESLRARPRLVSQVGFVDGYVADERQYQWMTTWCVRAADKSISADLLRRGAKAITMGRVVELVFVDLPEHELLPAHRRQIEHLAPNTAELTDATIIGFRRQHAAAREAALACAHNQGRVWPPR